jgi:mannan endo-1,4-beta-mannosidase
MRTFFLKSIIIMIMLMQMSCSSENSRKLADPDADKSVRDLCIRLEKAKLKGVIIGHQDATAYGVGWKYGEPGRTSDIQMICGDYPALYGWDLGHIENDSEFNLDTVSFKLTKKLIEEAYKRGGISTISWHADNPVTAESAWSQEETVKNILSDEKIREKFTNWLGKVASFLNSLKDENGEPIPVIFRPWHEWTGGWFWWGSPQTGNEDFREFWKFTVTTLRDKYHVHNVLYAFSSGGIRSKEEFMSKYPGDDFVDIIGFDTYVYNNDLSTYSIGMEENLRMFREMAETGNKFFAVTETGYESIPDSSWFTAVVYPLIRESGASYVLFWRNANKKHHYAPYPGDVSAGDFSKFHELPGTIFEKEMSEVK